MTQNHIHTEPIEIDFRVRDGRRLHARHYPAASSDRRAVICLPGLTRNSRDFHELATALSRHPERPRDVYALDYRGRGQSDRDPNWKNYSVLVEAQDVLDFLMRSDLYGSAVVGTSRGGLIAMVVAALQPTALGPTILNDIGPVIEAAGLVRIASYVGRTPVPVTWADAQTMLAAANRLHFPNVGTEAWGAIARQWFNEIDGRPAEGYDPALARTIAMRDGPPPPMWAQFMALKGKPLLVVRGELSDILSAATATEMCRRHPNAARRDVPGEGHAPLLRDAETVSMIERFLTEADQEKSVAGRSYNLA